jgi:outer membrane protein assembly factor BamB
MDRLNKVRLRDFMFISCWILMWVIALPKTGVSEDTLPTNKPIWTHEFRLVVRSVRSLEGPLVVATTLDTLFALDKITGEIVWRRAAYTTSNFNFSPVPGSNLALVSESRPYPLIEGKEYRASLYRGLRVTVLDLNSGLPLWSTDSLGDLVSLASIVFEEKGLCLLVLTDGGDKPWFTAVDLRTGNVTWERRSAFDDTDPELHRESDGFTTLQANPSPILDTDSTFIVFFTKNTVQKWDIRTGQLLWNRRVDDRSEEDKEWVHASMALSRDRQTVFVPCKRRLWALRTEDGTPAWPEPRELRGMIAQIQDLPDGTLVRCRRWKRGIAQAPCITLLDHETGRRVWKREFLDLSEYTVSDFVTFGDACYIWSENRIYRLGLQNGESSVLTDAAVVKGTETAVALFAREDGLLLLENQNAMHFRYDGEVTYRAYYQRPGCSDLEILLMAAVNLGVGAMVNNAMGHSWYDNSFLACSGLPNSSGTDTGSSFMDEDYMYMTVKKAGASQKVERKTITNRDKTITVDVGQKSGIVKVDLRTGKTVSELALDDDMPLYEVAPDDGLLFYVVRDRKITRMNHLRLEAYAF